MAASIDNFLIRYFLDDPRPSIYAQLNKKDHNLDDLHLIIEQTGEAQAKTAKPAFLVVQKSNIRYLSDHRPLKSEESRDNKSFEVKKNHYFPTANIIRKNRDKSNQTSNQ